MVQIGAKDFQGDGAVIAATAEQADIVGNINRACAQGEVQVIFAALIIVQMHMPEALAVSGEKFIGGVLFD